MLRPLPCYTLFTIASGTLIVKYKGFQILLIKKKNNQQDNKTEKIKTFSLVAKTDVT